MICFCVNFDFRTCSVISSEIKHGSDVSGEFPPAGRRWISEQTLIDYFNQAAVATNPETDREER